jgi:CheY-like chemotaxis protein
LTHERGLYAEAGMDALVAKPVEIPRLVEALARVLAIEPDDGMGNQEPGEEVLGAA